MRRKLILADDSIIIHKTVELVLSEKNIDIEIINDGEEALKVIKNEVPDIVLADIDLPEINGYELCSAVKKEPSLENVPVILLVESIKGFDGERAKKAGADDYLIKPFEPEELLSRIDSAMDLKDTVTLLENKLQKAEQKADKAAEILQSKTDAAEASKEIINDLRDRLLGAEKRAGEINKELNLLKESTEKILSKAMPHIADKLVEEMVHGHVRKESQRLTSELINAIGKAAEDRIPYIVEKAITEEIEKIKKNNR